MLLAVCTPHSANDIQGVCHSGQDQFAVRISDMMVVEVESFRGVARRAPGCCSREDDRRQPTLSKRGPLRRAIRSPNLVERRGYIAKQMSSLCVQFAVYKGPGGSLKAFGTSYDASHPHLRAS